MNEIHNLEVVFNRIVSLKDEIYQNAKKHGFWEKYDNKEKVMLIVSELGEALEADRKLHLANIEAYEELENRNLIDFETWIKDTLEDELSDSVIRVLDLGAYLKVKFEFNLGLGYLKMISPMSNLLYDLTSILMRFSVDYSLNYFLNTIIYHSYVFLNIDLEKFIILKMNYNNQREFKHGKVY